jgi:hypothetical protein
VLGVDDDEGEYQCKCKLPWFWLASMSGMSVSESPRTFTRETFGIPPGWHQAGTGKHQLEENQRLSGGADGTRLAMPNL